MAKDIKIIQVSFNVLDPDQLQVYEHVRRRPNRSGYLKRLAQRDMDGGMMAAVAPGREDKSDHDFTLEGFI